MSRPGRAIDFRRAVRIVVAAAGLALVTGSAVARPPIPFALPAKTGRAAQPPAPSGALWSQVPTADLPEHASVERLDGQEWLGAHDLARLLDATKFWRSDLRKLELRSQGHRVLLTADNPFALVDDRTIVLPAPVRSRGGQLRVPVALIDSLPQDTTSVRLVYDARRKLVLRVPLLGLLGSPSVSPEDGAERVAFPADHAEAAAVIGRGRAHFRVRFGGFLVGALPDSLPAKGLVRAIRAIPAATGTAFELTIAPEARGFRLMQDTRRGVVELTVTRSEERDVQRFAPEGPPGPRPLRVVVLDPGHGGADAGVTVGGMKEKDLTLALARELARDLSRHGVHVVMTRTEDRATTVQERAERANRAHADLVVSLHFDGAPGGAARGATAYCPAAAFSGSEEREDTSALPMLPWRDVSMRYAVRSRVLAEAVLSALDLRGLGPVRLREALPYPLLGVNAPGLMLECATLTSESDRTRLGAPQGIEELAGSIAAGIEAYSRAE